VRETQREIIFGVGNCFKSKRVFGHFPNQRGKKKVFLLFMTKQIGILENGSFCC
jgi:hypothetical protein